MALENILHSIEERRDAELDRLSREHQQKLEALTAEAERRLETLRSEYGRRTSEDSKSLENRELSNADIEARRIVRGRKSELVDDALAKAYETMDGLSSSPGYKAIITAMTATVKRTFGNDCLIHVGKEGAEFIKESRGRKIVVEEVDRVGGIIADSTDGTMELDLTISTLKREIKDRLMLEIAEKLGAK